MAAIVVLGVLALVAAIVAWVTWHRGADERQSVQHHQHTLETLRHVADRQPPSGWPARSGRGAPAKNAPTVRPTPSPGRSSRPARDGAPSQSPKTAPGTTRSPSRRRGATTASFHDVALEGEAPVPPRGVAPSSSSARESAKVEVSRRETVAYDDGAGVRGGRSSLTSAAHRMRLQLPGAAEQARRDGRARVRRTRIVAAAALIVAGGVGGALAFGPTHSPTRPPSGATTLPSRPITAAGHGLTTTTVPTHDLVPTAPTAFSAHYAAPSTAYAVAIHASSLCWVMATDPSSGRVVWTGTIAGGSSRSLSVSGDLAIDLGAPTDANVTMDGLPVQLPTGFRSPFTLTFVATS